MAIEFTLQSDPMTPSEQGVISVTAQATIEWTGVDLTAGIGLQVSSVAQAGYPSRVIKSVTRVIDADTPTILALTFTRVLPDHVGHGPAGTPGDPWPDPSSIVYLFRIRALGGGSLDVQDAKLDRIADPDFNFKRYLGPDRVENRYYPATL